MSATGLGLHTQVAADCLVSLRAVVAEIVSRAGGGRYGASIADDEWRSFEPSFKLCAVMLAGIEGDTAALCNQRWQRFTPAEREALTSALRSLRRGVRKLRACAL